MNRVELSRSVIYGDSIVSGIRLPVNSRRRDSGRALFPSCFMAFNSGVTGCAGMFSAPESGSPRRFRDEKRPVNKDPQLRRICKTTQRGRRNSRRSHGFATPLKQSFVSFLLIAEV